MQCPPFSQLSVTLLRSHILAKVPTSEVAGEGKHYKFFPGSFSSCGHYSLFRQGGKSFGLKRFYSPSCQAPKNYVGAHG